MSAFYILPARPVCRWVIDASRQSGTIGESCIRREAAMINAMTFIGARAAITWSASLLKSDRTFDCYVDNFGVMVPIRLGALMHVWDPPLTKFGSAKGLRLRPEEPFRRHVLLHSALWMGG